MSDYIFLVARNSDVTEGRGSDILVGIALTLEEAVESVHRIGIRGVGDGDVYAVTLPVALNGTYGDNLLVHENLVYGYQTAIDREGSGLKAYDYNYDHPAVQEAGFSAPIEDPEFPEYRRLRDKFND
jgi:hypothetical protein